MIGEKIVVSGRQLKCQICGQEYFEKRDILLNTAGASLLGFDWANREAACYICTSCGYIHWFHPDHMK